MTNWDREQLRRTFDGAAELYDKARPGYPEALFDDLIEAGGLGPDARLLEIGCGTGQATRALARRGHNILCLELGEALSAVGRRKLAPYPRVRVVTSSFEAWDPNGSSFDLVLAATSWHWVDPSTRYVKAAAALKPAGALAIITTHHVLPDDGDSFFVEIQDAYDAIGEADSPPPSPEEVGDDRADIEGSNLFGDVRVYRHLWEQTYAADDYLALLDTYSGHRLMAPAARDPLYEDIHRRIQARRNKRVRKHYLAILHVARRSMR